MDFSPLPPEQAERAEAIYQQLRQAGDARLRELAALLVHKLGAEALETAARQRKKGDTRGPA
jgi:hypothetical protein